MTPIFENKLYTIGEAQPCDTAAIKALFEGVSYPSLVDLQFRRGDDPYASFHNEDAGATVLLIRENATGKSIGMGACSYHTVYLHGEIKRVGYLNGLKLLPQYQKKFRYLPLAFRTMYDVTRSQADLYYATILSSSTQVQQLFEKPHRNMPVYKKQGIYTSFVFKPCANEQGLHLEKGNVAGLDAFYSRSFPRYNLAPVRRQMPGIADKDYITWRENGKILAACAIWNNQSAKNYYINAYNGILKILSHFPSRLLGYPAFPQAGSIANNATLSLLMFDPDVDLLSQARFIKAASSHAKDYLAVCAGLADNHPSYPAFRKIRHVPLSSSLYTVNWETPQDITELPLFTDVSFM